MAQAISEKKDLQSYIKRYLPIAGWLPKYRPGWLRIDVLAGLTVVALLVPEGMAYAELAGMPPQAAFYAAIPALILYAIFGSSKQLVVATSSTIAVMSAATIGELAPADTQTWLTLTAALAMLAGLISIIAGFFRLGRISQFFSESVLTGFTFGLALVIAMKQLPKIFGLEAADGNFFQRLYDLLINLVEAHWLTFLVGISSIGLMVLLERRWKRIPAALVTLIYGIFVVSVFNLDTHGVHVVGEIPSGLVRPQLPGIDFEVIMALIPGAIAIALVAFAEAIGPARQFAAEHRYEINADQELIAIGFANFGAGLFQGYPVGASLSKSAANENAGAKSSVSLLVAAAVTVLVALFLTPLFRNLPEATLAAIVIVAISGMMNVPALRRYYSLRRTDFWLAIVALFAVLFFEILFGLAIAVVVSLLILILRAARPSLSELGRHPGWLYFGDVDRHPEYITFPGLVIVRPNEGIFFANATPLREAIMDRIRQREVRPKAVLVDLEMTFEVDVATVDMLAELKNELSRWQIDLYLSRVHEDVREMLARSGVATTIGPDHINQFFLDSLLQFLADQSGSLEYDQARVQKDLDTLAELIEDVLMRVGDDESVDYTTMKSNLRRISGDG